MRSKWKIPYCSNKIIDKLENFKDIKIWHRNSSIIEELKGKTVLVHNGKKLSRISIESNMIGFKLGQFSFTRKLGKIHRKK